MTASAHNLLLLVLAVTAGWILEETFQESTVSAAASENTASAVIPEDDARASVAWPQVSEPTASQEAAPGVEAESGPKNIVHLLPPPVTNEFAPKSSDNRHAHAQSGKSRSSRDQDRADETAAFSNTSTSSTTPQDLVRERATQRDLERRRRIEGRRWIGYEPSRPMVSAIPFMSGTNWQPMVGVVPRTVPDYRGN
ncbi:MAG: hypothetical protein NTY19_12550 [Planctomycetota bacterium]|nr:hypothetical protein [Planctomycetota bacterium]